MGRTIAVGRLPLDLLRGVSGEEEVLKNAKHACATEALEIATYRALEQIAGEAGDPQTAEIAREIRLQEEQMLRDVVDDIVPELATEVVDAEVTGYGTYEARTDAAGTPDARAPFRIAAASRGRGTTSSRSPRSSAASPSSATASGPRSAPTSAVTRTAAA